MKPTELRTLTDEQLEQVLQEHHAEWRHLRFQEAIGKLTATARIREIRKTIARIHTIRTERVMDAAIRARVEQLQRGRVTTVPPVEPETQITPAGVIAVSQPAEPVQP